MAEQPVVEIPSGVLADRWSRRGMLIIGTAAALISILLSGLSSTVLTYTLSVMVLGVYFATASGTLDSMVYDTVLEVTGDGQEFQRQIGRIRLIESVAPVGSALAGGWIAELTSRGRRTSPPCRSWPCRSSRCCGSRSRDSIRSSDAPRCGRIYG